MSEKVRVRLVRSCIGRTQDVRETVKGLGLRWVNQSVELRNTEAVRGMIRKVSYLLKVEE